MVRNEMSPVRSYILFCLCAEGVRRLKKKNASIFYEKKVVVTWKKTLGDYFSYDRKQFELTTERRLAP